MPTLNVYVRDAETDPIEGANVKVTPVPDGYLGGFIGYGFEEATTNASGLATFELEVGDYRVDAVDPATGFWHIRNLLVTLTVAGFDVDTASEIITQVTTAERTAGTETELRTFSPEDVAVMAGIHGPGGSPAASAVTFTPAGTIASTNVQDAIEEVAAEAGGSPAASAVTFTPVGGIAATDVQAALAEVDSEKLDASDIGTSVQAHSAVLDATTASFTTADETKVGFITVTQAVNLDTIESDTATNNAKVSYTDAAAVAANTAKVSADGSVGTHSDVTIGTPAGSTASTMRVLGDANTDGTYTVIDWTPPTGGGGEANTSSNSGVGEGLALAKSGVDLPFKSLVGGTDITLSSDATTVTIDADQQTVDVVSNVASGVILGRTTVGSGDSEELTPAAARTLLNVEDGATADQSDAEIETAYNNQVIVVSQAEAEAGTSTTVRRWTAQRVAQAIAALGVGGSFALPNRNDNTTETLTATTATRVSITTATITKTLPAISGISDGAFIAVTLDAVTEGTGSVTIARGSTDTIDWKGVALTSVVLHQDGDSVVFYADGDNSQWRLVHDGLQGPWFEANRITSAQSLTTDVVTKLQFNGETSDYWAAYDNATNYRWTPLVPGWYCVSVNADLSSDGEGDVNSQLSLYKNGSLYRKGQYVHIFNDATRNHHDFWKVYLNGSTDYIEIYGLIDKSTGTGSFETTNSNFEAWRDK